MDRCYVALKATDTQGSAVEVFRREDRSALPVTDTAGVLIGVVTVDDVLDVAEEEATRAIQQIGGSEALGEPYMAISPFAHGAQARRLAGVPVPGRDADGHGDGILREGDRQGGRAGAVRAADHLQRRQLRLAGVHPGDPRTRASARCSWRIWWRVVRRELFSGLALGAILGAIGFARIAIWSAFSQIYGQHWFLVALTVAFALVGVVLWGSLVGSMLPFILRRLGFDPATSSAPFVATLVDVTGLIIYFSVGLVILRGTLL